MGPVSNRGFRRLRPQAARWRPAAELGGQSAGPRATAPGGAGRPSVRGAPGPRFPAELAAETAAGGGAGSRAIEPPCGWKPPRPAAELGDRRPARGISSSDLHLLQCNAKLSVQQTNLRIDPCESCLSSSAALPTCSRFPVSAIPQRRGNVVRLYQGDNHSAEMMAMGNGIRWRTRPDRTSRPRGRRSTHDLGRRPRQDVQAACRCFWLTGPLELRTRGQPPRVSVCAELGDRPAAEPQAARWRPSSAAELAARPAPGPGSRRCGKIVICPDNGRNREEC